MSDVTYTYTTPEQSQLLDAELRKMPCSHPGKWLIKDGGKGLCEVCRGSGKRYPDGLRSWAVENLDSKQIELLSWVNDGVEWCLGGATKYDNWLPALTSHQALDAHCEAIETTWEKKVNFTLYSSEGTTYADTADELRDAVLGSHG